MTVAELQEANAKASALKSQQLANVGKLVHKVHQRHIFALEGLILQYQAALLKAARNAKTPSALVKGMSDVATTFVTKACDSGYARALSDLRARGWLHSVVGNVSAPAAVVDSIIKENDAYLNDSLKSDVPDLSDAALTARVKLYGHFLWRAAERAYIHCCTDFTNFLKQRPKQSKVVVVNPNKVTRVERRMMPASAVAKLPGMMSEHSQDLHDEVRVTDMARKIVNAGSYEKSGLPLIKLAQKHDGSLAIDDGNHRARGAAQALGDKPIPVQVAMYGASGLREGGAGSGDFGHSGREGEVGGSASMDTLLAKYVILSPDHDQHEANLVAALTPEYRADVAAKFDAENPNGITLYRGLSGEAALQAKSLKKGMQYESKSLISTSRKEDIAQYYVYSPITKANGNARVVLVFEGVRGKDLVASKESNPAVFADWRSRTQEVILDRNERWTVTDKYSSFITDQRPNSFGKTYTTTYIHLKRSDG